MWSRMLNRNIEGHSKSQEISCIILQVRMWSTFPKGRQRVCFTTFDLSSTSKGTNHVTHFHYNGNVERVCEEEFFGNIYVVMTLFLHKKTGSGNAYLFISGQGSRASVLESLMHIHCRNEDTVDYCLTHMLKKIQKAEMDWHILVVLTFRVAGGWGGKECFPLTKYELCERTGS